MKIVAFVVAVLGAIVGVMVGLFEATGHAPVLWSTYGLSAAGALGGLAVLLGWRFSGWWLLAVAVIGVIPDSILWEGPGSFFLASALMSFSLRAVQKGA